MQPSVAVVGTGYWGRNHVRTWHQLGALAFMCDSNVDALAEVRQLAPGLDRIATTTSFDYLLGQDKIEAIVLATPVSTHFDLSRRALLAGKHVLVEKPMTQTSDQARQLIELATQCHRVLMVGHVLKYHPAMLMLKQLIDNGRLGQIYHYHCNRLNLGQVRHEENALWSLAPHDISLLLMFTGAMPTTVQCRGWAWLQPNIYDITKSFLDFSDGSSAHVHVSWIHPYKEHRISVVGSKGNMVFTDSNPNKQIEFYSQPVEFDRKGVPSARQVEPQIIPYPDQQPLTAECQHFLDCIRSAKTPRSDGQDGFNVLQVLEQLQQSADQGGRLITL